ncbi:MULTISPECIES: metal-sensing transcriptional repressor [unclassified Geomicrobium]|uniref:DNA-binding FrmR family transcriptional regulator n=2 Tax=Bacillales incertae sedis TaxID=539002 RepID=A0ABS2PIB6_9BACL|nr:DNA-binding FrmR family transcriptional regulator [Geomicrobium sediminis]GAJ99744.1 repressor CsoR of the copZA operon [Geomicrobium sp. JCM 19055]
MDEEVEMMEHEHSKHPIEPNADKERMLKRLRRVEGQIRGLQNMVQDDRYCVDILIQISAVQAALKKVGYSLLEHHAKTCVVHDIKNGKEEETLNELMKVIDQYAKS